MIKYPNTPGIDESMLQDFRLWDALPGALKRYAEALPQNWGARTCMGLYRKWGDAEGAIADLANHVGPETQNEGRQLWPDYKSHPQYKQPFTPIECRPQKKTVRELRMQRLADVKLTQLRRGS
jgi:hypothetical protein